MRASSRWSPRRSAASSVTLDRLRHLLLAQGVAISGVMFIFMGWTMSQSARGATMQQNLLGEPSAYVSDVMDRQPVVMPCEASVQQAFNEYFWRYRWPWFPVVDASGHFLGLVEQHSVELVEELKRGDGFVRELVGPESGNNLAVDEQRP